MITPNEDKAAIKEILEKDPYIIRAGFTPENILTTRYGTDTLNFEDNDFRIFIYLGPPERTYGWMQKGVVFRVVVAGKRSRSAVIDSVSSQIIALLAEREISDCHILQLLFPPLELESNPAIYMQETSFICYQTVFNQIKK